MNKHSRTYLSFLLSIIALSSLGFSGIEGGILFIISYALCFFENISIAYKNNDCFQLRMKIVFGIFIGYFFTLIVCFSFLPATIYGELIGIFKDVTTFQKIAFSEVSFAHFENTIPHNLIVALLSLVLVGILGKKGISLVLSWNTLVWSLTFFHNFLLSSKSLFELLLNYLKFVIILFPHTLIEGVGYILVAISTHSLVSISQQKQSPQSRRAKFAQMNFMLTGICCLILAGVVEYYYPAIVRF